ncbi:MAG: tetratricopeptide repeat protein [Novosphingobium sp.]|uniref:tetratricopeptide repeat protein n=1 Tax=Novosphingobium sp. TaxID=1874826 RepID=UPI001D7A671B|nr:tetratricopeptide repeat protein [Novosphingobium sp.]MCB2056756.1 tetratricopeptide repeat protein [Novosphingobium sp.]MCP5387724.1 tetratricopeptide repeat protein [Novosphingobium sp.]
MFAKRTPRKLKSLGLPLGLAGVAAIALMAGTGISTTAGAAPSPDRTAAEAQAALAKGKVDKAISLAEGVVASNPREAAYRALLGNAYLRAGRFESAAQAFNDAMKLGDNSTRTALALSLAQIGAGRNRDAVAILQDWRDAIPAADLGLALALAGESGRGVAILSDAVRAGDNSPKVRQNLAYAFALDGRWREARLMTEQDLPADKVDDRISNWAQLARPEDTRKRVAALLNVPVRADAGQPAALALVDSQGAEQLAAESTAATSPYPATAELPPVAATAYAPAPVPAYAPAPAPAELSHYTPVSASVAVPTVRQNQVRTAPAYHSGQSAFVSIPVVQDLPSDYSPARAANTVASARPKGIRPRQPRNIAYSPMGGGTHMVQLGSFLSEQGARRAWGIYARQNPELKKFRMNISQATVRGRHYWRVAAAGLDGNGASGLCSSVKGRGGACFAYTATRTLPGHVANAPMLARAKPAAKPAAQPANQAVSGPANARRH